MTRRARATLFSGRQVAVACALLLSVAGCQTDPGPAPPAEGPATRPDPVRAALADVRGTDRRVALFIVDPTRSKRERDTADFIGNGASVDREVLLRLDSSADRALAAAYHPSTTRPTTVFLSPAGLILGRREGDDSRPPLSASTMADDDRRYAALQAAASARTTDVPARMALADFLLAHTNDREAIPHLRFVADDLSADLPTRVRAWVALGRAHLWVGEPEKARHAAQALIATLGPRSADAVVGGNLVRGLQDAKAKRYDRAHDEFAAAVAASPASPYGKEAADGLKALPPPR